MNKRVIGSFLVAMTLFGIGVVSTASAAVPDQPRSTYIIVFKDGVNARAEADGFRGQGFEVRIVYENLFQGVALDLPEAAAKGISKNSNVAFIEKDFLMSVNATQSSPTWGLDRSDQRLKSLSGTYTYPDSAGSGVNMYVVDSGVRKTHVDFGMRVADGYTAINDGVGTNDCYGHGTHVAGTIAGTTYGVAKAATVVPVRVLDCSGSGYVSWIASGLDWIAANRNGVPSIANMSLGGGGSTTIDSAVTRLHNSGVTVVVAAGNSNVNACGGSPARVGVAVTVGATSNTDARASFSNFGPCLDIFAPGVNVLSAVNTSDTATTTYSGTSMASPHVAGAAALVLGANPTMSPTQVRNRLVSFATCGAVTSAGTGSPNALLYVQQSGDAVQAPCAFTKASPANTATNVRRNATLSWVASPNAASYEVCIIRSTTTPTTTAINGCVWTPAGSFTSVVTSTLAASTAYYWQVRAVNDSGTNTDASGGWWSFKTGNV